MNNFLKIIHLQCETDLVDCFSTTSTTTPPKICKLAIHLNRDVKRVVLPDLETTKQLRSTLFCNPRSGEVIVFHRMEQLRHLYIPCLLNSNVKFKLNGLGNLKTLAGFDKKSYDVNDLCKLINLWQLEQNFLEVEQSRLCHFHQLPKHQHQPPPSNILIS
ncbi:hypothetical protein ACSBR2_041892 [Camellia fascicularis]